MTSTYDILGLGVVAVDDLLYVDGWPAPDVKVRVRRRERQCGGLTGTALIAAARLGARCAYAGTLGDDEFSRFVVDAFQREEVDTTRVVHRDDATPVLSTVVVDETRHTRNIFYQVPASSGADATRPDDDFIRAARVLFVDQYGVEGMIRAARVACEAGRTVLADFEHAGGSPRFDELLALVDHLVVPAAFARTLTGEDDPASGVRRLMAAGREVVCVTCGTDGAYFVSSDEPGTVRHQAAFEVETVDTTGCGDVFHGAYAFALARGMPVAARVRLASAAAAIKARHPGGQKGIPTFHEVETFLNADDAQNDGT
jgi:ribokinase